MPETCKLKQRNLSWGAVALCFLAIAPAVGQASLITSETIGTPALPRTGNCNPVGCPGFFALNTYEQVYASTAFSGTITIDELTFLDSVVRNGGVPAGGTYSLYLSYTNMPVGGLNLQNPVGEPSGRKPFFAGRLPALANGTLDFTGLPFTYNPNDGNLLLTVTVSGGSNGDPFLYLDQAAGTTQTTNAYFGEANGQSFSGGNHIGGLVTEFNRTAATPEPGSLLLILAGASLLGCRAVGSFGGRKRG
jgi:hypothetical protein